MGSGGVDVAMKLCSPGMVVGTANGRRGATIYDRYRRRVRVVGGQ